MNNDHLIAEIESLIRRDPARRGLIGADGNGPGNGELVTATRLFLNRPTGIGLMTGFFIPATVVTPADRRTDSREFAGSNHPTGHAETDGPPGTVLLADVLTGLGIPVTLITDELCEPVLRAACTAGSRHDLQILVSPIDQSSAAEWRFETLKQERFQQISHFVAIERVGPGYTAVRLPDAPENATRRSEPASPWQPGHCCNMRGESIDVFSADLHLLVETAKANNPTLQVIGIGDGGNEIGMGRFPWSELRARLTGPHADRVPCRVQADATIVAGVSNWGAYALAAAIAIKYDRVDLLERHTAEDQQQVLDAIVQKAGAVDGVTRQNESTVDGLPFLTQIQPWIAIRQRLGLSP